MSSERDELVLAATAGRRVGRNGWVRANCPFCALSGKEDRRQKLSLQTESGGWHCFQCRERGRLSGDHYAPREVPADLPALRPELPEGWLPLWKEPALSSMACAPALAYLAKRGVDRHMTRIARVGVCLRGSYANRLVIPIDDAAGRLAGWVSRTWGPKGMYRYMPGMARGDLLYNAAALAVETTEPVLVVEGVFDCFPFWPDAVAVLGKPSAGQTAALVAAKRPIAVVLDGDAWREGAALALTLRQHGQRAGWLELPARVDPDELPPAVVWEGARACLA